MDPLEPLLTESSMKRQPSCIYGAVTAIVQNNRDPANLGRIQIAFPWLTEAGEGIEIKPGERAAPGVWARLAVPLAGRNCGTWFMPDPDDEVVVVFERGDLDRPIVIGSLWNKEDPPPLHIGDEHKNDVCAIFSHSGHKIIFDDSEEKPSIKIVDKTGSTSITLDTANNALAIRVAGDLRIDVGGSITISANQEIRIRSASAVSVEGSARAELKGAMVSVNSSGVTEVKGGLVKIN